MDINIVLSIVGSCTAVALSINAFFLRGISKDISDMRVDMAKLETRSNDFFERIKRNENEIRDISTRINDLGN